MSENIDKLIINSAYEEPAEYWNYSHEEKRFKRCKGRRPAGYLAMSSGSITYDDFGSYIELPLVNEIRKRVKNWRATDYPGVTSVTKKLIKHWNDSDVREYPFFFCQLDAIETLIWLSEAPDSEKEGVIIEQTDNEFYRLCSKMATGSGKTIVMAMLIAWHVLNKVTYPDDERFSKNIFVVAPGLTVKERLSVLNPSNPQNYYDRFRIVPLSFREKFNQGNLLIENWHSLSWDSDETIRKRKSVDKRGPLSDEAYVREVLGDLSKFSNIVVINDEAHHAWKHNPEIKTRLEKQDEEYSTIWVGGLERIHRARGILTCYDFSATPFAPSGKKNIEDALFPWIVSDFGLNDAMESGLVKTPRLVVRDDGRPDASTYKSKLYHIYGQEEVKKDFSRPAQPQESLPDLVINAYDLLGADWLETFEEWKEGGAQTPPVMITVTNRTHTASRIEYAFLNGKIGVPELSNSKHICKIDSETIKKIESGEERIDEIQFFNLQDDNEKEPTNKEASLILRETANTVGQMGKLGEQIRNVISVGMLSEGWDAKTVTHIMGLRAFSSQLLCEQVIGRGLRRTAYETDENGLFSPEYVQVFGIPFSFLPFEGDGNRKKSNKPQTLITSLDERSDLSIEWPNVIRVEHTLRSKLSLDLDKIEPLIIDRGDAITRAEMAPYIGEMAYSGEYDLIELYKKDEYRLQTIIFKAASELYKQDWGERGTGIALFGQLARIIEEFLDSNKINFKPPIEKDDNRYSNLLALYMSRIVNHIRNYIVVNEVSGTALVLDSNRPVISTIDMPPWYTSRPCDPTKKSQVSHVVYDSRLESFDAFSLDNNPSVVAWVKNDHIGFEIPYFYNGAFLIYRPDFIIRLTNGHHLVLETKGLMSEKDRSKRSALKSWINAINENGGYGTWHEDVSSYEVSVDSIIKKYSEANL